MTADNQPSVKPLRKVRGRYSPTDPVVQGSTTPCPNMAASLVVSACVGTNAELMQRAASLWIAPGDVVVDATYGRGVFWRGLPGVLSFGHDLAGDGVDLRALPYADGSLDVLVLDPPYRPTHGSKSAVHGLGEAYHVGTKALDTIEDVTDLYRGGIIEANRVLRPGGRAFIKCQDLSYGHRLHLFTYDVLRLATSAGLDLFDQFILVNQSQLTSTKWERQERARRSHSVLWIVGKP